MKHAAKIVLAAAVCLAAPWKVSAQPVAAGAGWILLLSTQPAGSSGEIQFNNNGVFGAAAGLSWDGTILSATKILISSVTNTGNGETWGTQRIIGLLTAKNVTVGGTLAHTGPGGFAETYGISAATGVFSGAVSAVGVTNTGSLAQSGAAAFTGPTVAVTYGVAAATGVFSGAVSATGLTNTGALANTGALTNVGSVTISTAATSSDSMCILGSVDALPTSTYKSGCFAKLNSNQKVYVSTMSPVTAAGDWKALW